MFILNLQLWKDIVSGKAIEDSSLLSKFLLLTFAVSTEMCSLFESCNCLKLVNLKLTKCVFNHHFHDYVGLEEVSLLVLVCLSSPDSSRKCHHRRKSSTNKQSIYRTTGTEPAVLIGTGYHELSNKLCSKSHIIFLQPYVCKRCLKCCR